MMQGGPPIVTVHLLLSLTFYPYHILNFKVKKQWLLVVIICILESWSPSLCFLRSMVIQATVTDWGYYRTIISKMKKVEEFLNLLDSAKGLNVQRIKTWIRCFGNLYTVFVIFYILIIFHS